MGEFFSDLAVDLKRRSPIAATLFVGYCNGHDLYFPTLRAIEEQPLGYGSAFFTAWIEPGGPEEMINRALANIERLLEGSGGRADPASVKPETMQGP